MKNSLFKNTIYKLLLNFVNIVVPLIIGPYVTKLLDVELYGIYNNINSIFQFFLVFASFGIYYYGVREISKIRDDKEKVSSLLSNLLAISIITNLITTIIYIVYSLIVSNGIETIIYLLFIIQFVGNIIYVEFINEALENYKFITIKSIIVKIIYFVLVLLFVLNPNDIIIYTIIVSLTVFLNNLVSFIYAIKHIKITFKKIEIKKYLKPLLIIAIITNIDLLYSQLDRIMLGKFVSNVSVSIYYISYFLIATLGAIPYSIINVSIPRLTYLLKNENKQKYEEKLKYSISSILFIVIPLCFGVFVVAKEAIIIYAGEKYLTAIPVLMAACIIKIVITLESIMNNLVLYPHDKEKRVFYVSLSCGILNLILNSLLIIFKIFSPLTAMITTGFAELIVFIVQYNYSKKQIGLNISIFSRENITYLLLGLLFIPISHIVRLLNYSFALNLLLIIVLCIFLYISLLFIKKDRNIIFLLSKVKNIFKKGK